MDNAQHSACNTHTRRARGISLISPGPNRWHTNSVSVGVLFGAMVWLPACSLARRSGALARLLRCNKRRAVLHRLACALPVRPRILSITTSDKIKNTALPTPSSPGLRKSHALAKNSAPACLLFRSALRRRSCCFTPPEFVSWRLSPPCTRSWRSVELGPPAQR